MGMTLKYIGKRMGVCGLDWSGSGQGPVCRLSEQRNEPSGSMKGGSSL